MNYKVIEILKTFSNKDLKDFELFLQSPFFNDSQKIRNLYKILTKFHPNFNSPHLTEENLSKQLSPDLAYKKSTFKSLLFEMANLADEYLKVINLRGRQFIKEDFLRDEYIKRKLYKYFDHNLRNAEKNLIPESGYQSNYFLNLFRLHTDRVNYLAINKAKSKKFIPQVISIYADRIMALSIYFSKEALVQYTSMKALGITFNIEEEKNITMKLFKVINYEELIKLLIAESKNNRFSVILELDLNLYKVIFDYKNEQNYFNYKKIIIKNTHLMHPDEISYHFKNLIANCMMRIRDKESVTDFRTELFNLYKYFLLNKYYKQGFNRYMPVELFKSVLNLGLELKKYVWTLNFIKKFYNELHPERKMNMYYYSLAEYYFRRKKFDLALRNFHKVELSHFTLTVDIRNLMLMTYYELQLYENALQLIDSYKHFLSNDRTLSEDYKKNLRNFILVVNKMIHYRTSVKAKTKYDIKQNITRNILYKEWIDEKVLELDSKFTKSA